MYGLVSKDVFTKVMEDFSPKSYLSELSRKMSIYELDSKMVE